MKTGLQINADFSTRHKRRGAIKAIHACLSKIRDAEQRYLENVPDNLLSSDSVDVGECAVDALDEIIGLLADVY